MRSNSHIIRRVVEYTYDRKLSGRCNAELYPGFDDRVSVFFNLKLTLWSGLCGLLDNWE
jgi:hypothetical protein